MPNRGGRGRKTPVTLQVLAGNPGKRAKRTPSASLTPLGEPPAWLPEAAKEIFAELAERLGRAGQAGELDALALADCALCVARVRELEAMVERDGLVIDGRYGPTAHPAARLVRVYRQALQQWARQLGLTPASRPLAGDAALASVDDPIATLLERRDAAG